MVQLKGGWEHQMEHLKYLILLRILLLIDCMSLTGRLMPDLPECWEKLHKIDDGVLVKVEGTKQIVYSQKL